jgi:hypothetical protein
MENATNTVNIGMSIDPGIAVLLKVRIWYPDHIDTFHAREKERENLTSTIGMSIRTNKVALPV